MDEKKIEEKIEEISRKVETKMKEMGDLVDEKLKEHFSDAKTHHHKQRYMHSTNFWGIILIIFGILFLAKNIHWIHWNLPIFPVILIIIGAYLIYGGKRD